MYKNKPWTLEKESTNSSKQEALEEKETLAEKEALVKDIRTFFRNSWKNSYSIEELNKIFKKDTDGVVHLLARNGEINFGISSSGIVYSANSCKSTSTAVDTEKPKKECSKSQKKPVKKRPPKIAELVLNYAKQNPNEVLSSARLEKLFPNLTSQSCFSHTLKRLHNSGKVQIVGKLGKAMLYKYARKAKTAVPVNPERTTKGEVYCKVKEFFEQNSNLEFSSTMILEQLKVNPSTGRKAVKELLREGVIKITNISRKHQIFQHISGPEKGLEVVKYDYKRPKPSDLISLKSFYLKHHTLIKPEDTLEADIPRYVVCRPDSILYIGYREEDLIQLLIPGPVHTYEETTRKKPARTSCTTHEQLQFDFSKTESYGNKGVCYDKVRNLFCENPHSIYSIKDIQTLFNYSSYPVYTSLSRLLKEGVIKIVAGKTGKKMYYQHIKGGSHPVKVPKKSSLEKAGLEIFQNNPNKSFYSYEIPGGSNTCSVLRKKGDIKIVGATLNKNKSIVYEFQSINGDKPPLQVYEKGSALYKKLKLTTLKEFRPFYSSKMSFSDLVTAIQEAKIECFLVNDGNAWMQHEFKVDELKKIVSDYEKAHPKDFNPLKKLSMFLFKKKV